MATKININWDSIPDGTYVIAAAGVPNGRGGRRDNPLVGRVVKTSSKIYLASSNKYWNGDKPGREYHDMFGHTFGWALGDSGSQLLEDGEITSLTFSEKEPEGYVSPEDAPISKIAGRTFVVNSDGSLTVGCREVPQKDLIFLYETASSLKSGLTSPILPIQALDTTKIKNGMYFNGFITGVPCTGRVYVDMNVLYLLQNQVSGCLPPVRYGYTYGYCVRLDSFAEDILIQLYTSPVELPESPRRTDNKFKGEFWRSMVTIDKDGDMLVSPEDAEETFIKFGELEKLYRVSMKLAPGSRE